MAGGLLINPNSDPIYQSPGEPAAGATLEIKITGTDTLASVYTDIGLTSPITNPLTADGAGLFYTGGGLFVDATRAYDLILTPPNGQGPYTYENVWPVGAPIDLDAYLQNPSTNLTGFPTAPTPSVADNSESVATTAFVNNIFQTVNTIPVGSVFSFATNNLPAGWLLCDGSLVSRTGYARLFQIIGTTWGSGDGATTFNIPNLGGYFVRGWTPAQAVDANRAFASTQLYQLGDHRHGFKTSQFIHTGTQTTYSSGGNDPIWDNPEPALTSAVSWIAGSTSIASGTRPKNWSINYAIKF